MGTARTDRVRAYEGAGLLVEPYFVVAGCRHSHLFRSSDAMAGRAAVSRNGRTALISRAISKPTTAGSASPVANTASTELKPAQEMYSWLDFSSATTWRTSLVPSNLVPALRAMEKRP